MAHKTQIYTGRQTFIISTSLSLTPDWMYLQSECVKSCDGVSCSLTDISDTDLSGNAALISWHRAPPVCSLCGLLGHLWLWKREIRKSKHCWSFCGTFQTLKHTLTGFGRQTVHVDTEEFRPNFSPDVIRQQTAFAHSRPPKGLDLHRVTVQSLMDIQKLLFLPGQLFCRWSTKHLRGRMQN